MCRIAYCGTSLVCVYVGITVYPRDLRVNWKFMLSRFFSIERVFSSLELTNCLFACVYRVHVCTCVFTGRASPNYSSSFNETDALPARTVFVLDRLTEQVFCRFFLEDFFLIDCPIQILSNLRSLLEKIIPLSNHLGHSSHELSRYLFVLLQSI